MLNVRIPLSYNCILDLPCMSCPRYIGDGSNGVGSELDKLVVDADLEDVLAVLGLTNPPSVCRPELRCSSVT